MVWGKGLRIHTAVRSMARERARVFVWTLILLYSATAGIAMAQSEGRPDVAVPEPQRKAASRSFVLSAVTYDMAVEGRDRFSSALGELVRFFAASTEVDATLSWNKHDLNARYAQQPLLLYMTGNEAAFAFGEYEKKSGKLLEKRRFTLCRRRRAAALSLGVGAPVGGDAGHTLRPAVQDADERRAGSG